MRFWRLRVGGEELQCCPLETQVPHKAPHDLCDSHDENDGRISRDMHGSAAGLPSLLRSHGALYLPRFHLHGVLSGRFEISIYGNGLH